LSPTLPFPLLFRLRWVGSGLVSRTLGGFCVQDRPRPRFVSLQPGLSRSSSAASRGPVGRDGRFLCTHTHTHIIFAHPASRIHGAQRRAPSLLLLTSLRRHLRTSPTLPQKLQGTETN
jgi:hypothetical protein